MSLALELCRRFPLVAEHLPIRLAADARARGRGWYAPPHRDPDPTLTAALDRLHEPDMPARPAPPEAMMTPEGWQEWYAAMPADAQLAVWRVVQSNQGDLHRCWVERHDARIEWLERALGEALNVPSGGAQGPAATDGDPASVVIQTPDHGDRNTTSRNTFRGERPCYCDEPRVSIRVEEGPTPVDGYARCLNCRGLIGLPDDKPAGPPPEPMPVTSFDCFVMGRHNPYADHTEADCDRGKHYIPVPMSFVRIKDCE